ncbi:MAG: hypothetical protein KAT68_07955 [Bacteroidales bacterium]|nr:hypothetical protein [Bacteroidales bacterium]
MGNLALNIRTLDKYFGILKNLTVDSKKYLIIKLTESIQTKEKIKTNLDEIYGAWQDSRTAEEIITEIETSRFNERKIEDF